jgi:hypothetical protein
VKNNECCKAMVYTIFFHFLGFQLLSTSRSLLYCILLKARLKDELVVYLTDGNNLDGSDGSTILITEEGYE